MESNTRLHALDNLRAVMMWLGVVLHTAALHRPEPSGLGWQDSQVTPLAGLVCALIHAFRMPAFFIVAGFFVALLVERLGVAGMLRHRAMRIALPLLLLGPPIFAAIAVLSTMHAQPAGQSPVFALDITKVPPTPSGAHVQTLHLWFIYQLMGLVVLAALAYRAARGLPAGWCERVGLRLQAFASHPLACLALALPLAVVGRHHRAGILEATGELLPPFPEWVHFGLFFGFGLLLYHQRGHWLPLLQRRVAAHAWAGTAFFVLAIGLFEFATRVPGAIPYERIFIGWAYNACAWLWSWALIGGFLRWLPRHSAALAFVAASSYWMYLVHLPIVGAVSLVIREWELGSGWKMLLNIAITSALCLVTYQWLVRRTFIGVLLNGRRDPVVGARGKPAHSSA